MPPALWQEIVAGKRPAPESGEAVDPHDAVRRYQAAELAERFAEQVGPTYAEGVATFDTYKPRSARQIAVHAELKSWPLYRDYKRLASICLYGPCGVGKDHLLIALGWKLIRQHAVSVRWVALEAWFNEVAENRRRFHPITPLMDRLIGPGVVILSDPWPVGTKLTEVNAKLLYEVADARRHRSAPIWLTANASSVEEMQHLLGGAVASRILGGAEIRLVTGPDGRNSTSGLLQ